MPSVDIPQEIIDLVVENLTTDLKTLRQCSSVSTSFFLSCRRHLFAGIAVRSAGQCERLYAILSADVEIPHMIRRLSLVESGWVHRAPLEAILQLIVDCSKLEEFSLSYLLRLKEQFARPTFLNSSAMKDLFRSPHLNSVTIKGVPVCLFPMEPLMATSSLQHLTFEGNCFNNMVCKALLNQGTATLSSPSFNLHSLDVRCNHADHLILYLSGSLSQLQMLRIWLPSDWPLFPAIPISCRLLPELRLVVLELNEYNNIESLDAFATDGLPRNIEHFVILIPPHTLHTFTRSVPLVEGRISAMLTPADEYLHIQGVHFVMVVRHRDSPPSHEKLAESFPLLQGMGLLNFVIGDIDEVGAALKVLE